MSCSRVFCAAVLVLLLGGSGHAQSGGQAPGPAPHAEGAQPTDERRYLLDVRRNQILLEQARSELERVKKLNDEGLMSRADLDRSQSAYARAEINFQESLLALLDVQPRISVARAVKQQSRDGKRYVVLTLFNETPG